MIVIFYFLVPTRLLLVTISCILMTLFPLFGNWYNGMPFPQLLSMTIFSLLFNILGFNVMRKRNQLRRREYASRLELVQAARAATDANEKLRASEERFRDFVTGVPIGFFCVSMDGIIIEANPAILNIFEFKSLVEANRAGGTDSNGLLTAEKVLSLPLVGTEMVVLSACETGVGKVQSGQGVFGLRRAFLQAGSKSLVMSMWGVPDLETRELMTAFYRCLTGDEKSRARALRLAVLEEMKIVRSRYGNVNPLFWGAFIFLGEP